MYLSISIGNTDNKLTQQEWSNFVLDVGIAIRTNGAKIHFFGGASNWEQWQNVAWILETEGNADSIIFDVKNIRKKYKQDSAFYLLGEGRFV